MDYKRIENNNIIENEKKNIKSETEIVTIYNNEIYDIHSDKISYISKYSGNKNIKEIYLYNNIITEKELLILDKNINIKNKIISSNNSFEIDAYMKSFERKEANNNTYINFSIIINRGNILPKGEYKIVFENGDFLKIIPNLYDIIEYYEDWGYSAHFFNIKKNDKIYISFKTALLDNNILKKYNKIFENHINGCIYLFEKSDIKKGEYSDIWEAIRNKKFIKHFNINKINCWNYHQFLFIPEKENYILIQAHNINNKGIIIPSILNNINIYIISENNLKYNHEYHNNLYEKTKRNISYGMIFFIGIIIGKYIYAYNYDKNINNIKKKYNKLESSYKYMINNKYNL